MIVPKSIFRAKEETEEKERAGDPFPALRRPEERCPEGYVLVLDYFRNYPGKSSMDTSFPGEGVYIPEHCRLRSGKDH